MKTPLLLLKCACLALMLVSVVNAQSSSSKQKFQQEQLEIAEQMERSIKYELLNKWYPSSVDSTYGGFLSTFTYDFQPTGPQDKMIVTQARHVWSNALAAKLYPGENHYRKSAEQGFVFLKNKMWDQRDGGFFTLVSRQGEMLDSTAKTAYGNAFGIYALAAWYKTSNDEDVLQLAKDCFYWLEKAHDPLHKGYYQDLSRSGIPIKRTAAALSTSSLGYKDQNSSIHLLEAFTELYSVWPNELVRQRLQEMLYLIRDVITTPTGSLTLFLQPDWIPVSFVDSSAAVIMKHKNLDHISFGHDVETAYLMLEASHILGLKNDTATIQVAKKMTDHALQNGWDRKNGGFFDEGYYFKNQKGITIIKDSKNWWSQAECLNTLLLMANHFPNDSMQYFEKFKRQWQYIQTYLIDHQYGDWYEEGLDTRPQRKSSLKGHIWKATYHHFRSLSNCVALLRKKL